VALLDVNMPGMGGFETARRIRETPAIAHTPIIFVTAYVDDMQSAEGYAHGAVDFIQAPAIPTVLRAKVKVFADLFRMREELNRRRHLEVVRESSERIRLVLESSVEAVVTVNERGVVTGWNPQSEVLFGWSRDDAIGKQLAELI